MLDAIIAGALVGTLIGRAIVGFAPAKQPPKVVYTFGDPAAIVEQWEQQRAERGDGEP